MDFLRASFSNELFVASAGAGTRISVTISSLSRIVVLPTPTAKKSSASTLRFEVSIVAANAISAGAVSLGWTA